MANLGKYLSTDGRSVSVSFNDTIKFTRVAGEYFPPGIDSQPEQNATVIVMDLGSQSNKAVVGARRSSDQSIAKDGELRLFSSAGNVDIYLKEDGIIEIAGGGKSFMTFDDFATNWNNLIGWLSTHTHLDSSPAPTSPPQESIGTDISDISSSENQQVKTDG